MVDYVVNVADFSVEPDEINLSQLGELIDASAISVVFSYMRREGDNIIFVFETTPTEGDETIISDIVANYNPQPAEGQFVSFSDIKTVGTNGGSFVKDGWRTRDLNYAEGTAMFASLNSNQITLQSGRYRVSSTAPAEDVAHHQICLYNITDDLIELIGMNSYSSGSVSSYSRLDGIIEITSQKVFELRHRCSRSKSNIGFGRASGFGDEKYASITFMEF
jgi:hypothetical protein